MFDEKVSPRKQFKNKFCAAERLRSLQMNMKMSAVTSLFMCLQIRETKKMNKGHRFTIDKKMLSVSFYKRSPKCYNMLSKLFTLSSKYTIVCKYFNRNLLIIDECTQR